MKYFIILSLFVVHFLTAQDNLVYDIEYDNGSQMYGMAFDVNTCKESVIVNNWKDWVKSRSGKISLMKSILGKYEASEVHFNRDVYDLNFDVLSRQEDTLIVVNIFKLPNGEFLTQSSNPAQYATLQKTLKEFAYQTKKACVRSELEDANEYQAKLNDQFVSLQRTKARLEKDILHKQNRILKLDNKNRVLKENLDNYPLRLNEEVKPKRIEKIKKKQANDAKYLLENSERIADYQSAIQSNQTKILNVGKEIEKKNEELALQSELILNITKKLNQIRQ